MSSAATMTARHHETTRHLNEDTMNARIWLGIHFRRAMTDANHLGRDVTAFVVGSAFQPTGAGDWPNR